MKVSELAQHLSAPWQGQDTELTGVAALESAGPSELAFVGNRKAEAQAAASGAGCLLTTAAFASQRTLIRVADPRAAFARAIALLHPKTIPVPGIHASAVIDASAVFGEGCTIAPHVTVEAGAQIGPRCVIGPGCTVGANSILGADCLLHSHVTLYDHVIVGQRAILHAGCVLGADGFGFAMTEGAYRKFPQIGVVMLGDDVEIGANACVDRAALGVTRIGNGTKIDNMVHIGHNCRIGNHVVIAAQTGLSGGVIVEDYAVIGGQVGIGDKARIESRAVLGSGCGILTSKIVRKGQVVWGTPARPLREYLEQLGHLARLPQFKLEVQKELTNLRRQLEQSNGENS